MRIVEFINQNGKITNRDIRRMFNLSNRAALNEVKKLIMMKVLRTKGKGRNTYYELA